MRIESELVHLKVCGTQSEVDAWVARGLHLYAKGEIGEWEVREWYRTGMGEVWHVEVLIEASDRDRVVAMMGGE